MDILVIDDDEAIRDAAVQLIEDCDHYAEGAEDSTLAMEALKLSTFDVVLLDLYLRGENGLDVLAKIKERYPKVSVIMITGMGSIPDAVKATQLGALDFLEKPFSREQFAMILQRVKRHRQLEVKVEELKEEVATHQPQGTYESKSPVVRDALDVLFRAAGSTASILLLGESGTGKSMIAKEIHARSTRKNKPFVTVNCPALSKELLESELFGHVKGAFTGALRDTRGKVHAADGGTLFLDEIGELPKELQPKLLRLLQEWEYERVGDTKTYKADVRIIAATNRDLADEVKNGEFREDLYFRLNVISVALPSLRDRREDLLHFAEQYLTFFAKQYRKEVREFSPSAKEAVMRYPWPGNLREMRNAIERAVILAQGPNIDTGDLPAMNAGISVSNTADGDGPWIGGEFSMEEIEESHMLKVLETTSTLSRAAEILGINEATLYRKRKRLGLK
ncbi:sigma-54-dependent transcriptional regulator [Luteolibacter algae]|uniref:Sigma-54-dependent transcriptional regulator n=1 Tax=Luteolibacter algae TaxID=454151 RepID=A0ABW5D9K4_9BACT